MKTALWPLGLATILGLTPVGCSYGTKNPIVNDPCAAMGFYNDDDGQRQNQFEFEVIGGDMGSFEPGFSTPTDGVLVDDDDLLDDYPRWRQALLDANTAFNESAEAQAKVALFESMDPEKEESDFTAEETAAVAFVEEVSQSLSADCLRIEEPFIKAEPGDILTDGLWPSFTACKDRYNASGDGVVSGFELLREGHQEQDAVLASCPSLSGTDNNVGALNFWGPLTTQPGGVTRMKDGVTEAVPWLPPEEPRDGFTYSGITIPLTIATYQETEDRSDWEGIAFWARVANAEEAVAIGPTPAGVAPLSGREPSSEAGPQDGVGSLGVIIQTMDVSAVKDNRGGVDGMGMVGVCEDGEMPPVNFCLSSQEEFDAFPGLLVEDSDPARKYAFKDQNGLPQTPQVPFCDDYSPVDTPAGEETPFRDQCWDGFRTMVEVTHDWKFYFLPFDEMRQAGWGRVADRFRVDQIRSVNLLTSAFQPVNIMVDEIAYYRRVGTGPVQEPAPE